MSMYRCAVCGSPNVQKTNKNDGFSYKKALVGTAVFGTVGAVAGINGKEKSEFFCPDCGEHSEYPMDANEKMVIDSMISSRLPLSQYMDKYPYLKTEWQSKKAIHHSDIYESSPSYTDVEKSDLYEAAPAVKPRKRVQTSAVKASGSNSSFDLGRLSISQCIKLWNEFSEHFEKYMSGNYYDDTYLYLKEHMGQLNALAEKIATGFRTPVRNYEIDPRILVYHIFVTRNNRPMTPFEFYSKYAAGSWGSRFSLFANGQRVEALTRNIQDYRTKELVEWFYSVDLFGFPRSPLEEAIFGSQRLIYSYNGIAESCYVEPIGPFSGKNSRMMKSGLWYEDGKLYVSVDFFRENDYRCTELGVADPKFQRLTHCKNVPEDLRIATQSDRYIIEQKRDEVLMQAKKLFGRRKAKQMQDELDLMEEELRKKEERIVKKNKSTASRVASIAEEIGAIQLPSMKDDSYWMQIIPDKKRNLPQNKKKDFQDSRIQQMS